MVAPELSIILVEKDFGVGLHCSFQIYPGLSFSVSSLPPQKTGLKINAHQIQEDLRRNVLMGNQFSYRTIWEQDGLPLAEIFLLLREG